MKYLATPILEFVLAQPAHKLPVVFTLEECPLPDCSESSEDVLGEVLRLQKEGWIEAHVTRGVTGKPKQVEVRYVTLPGRNYLESRNTRGQVNKPASGLIRWCITGLVILVLVLLWVFGRHASSPREEQHAPAVSDLSGDTSVPTPLLVTSPEASATPDVSTSPVLAPSPTATPTPEPIASPSPSPSPHRKRVQR